MNYDENAVLPLESDQFTINLLSGELTNHAPFVQEEQGFSSLEGFPAAQGQRRLGVRWPSSLTPNPNP